MAPPRLSPVPGLFLQGGVLTTPAERSWRVALDLRCFTRVSLVCGLLATGMSLSCKDSGERASSEQAPALASEPVRFSFELPSSYVPVELRGEGSETLRAPAGARATPLGKGFRVEAGPEFVLDITPRAPAMSELLSAVPAAQRVVDEQDLVVLKSGSGHAFVVVRELVPEWDESDRERFACSSSGALSSPGGGGADARGFSRSALQNMVAACRSLALPKLE